MSNTARPRTPSSAGTRFSICTSCTRLARERLTARNGSGSRGSFRETKLAVIHEPAPIDFHRRGADNEIEVERHVIDATDRRITTKSQVDRASTTFVFEHAAGQFCQGIQPDTEFGKPRSLGFSDLL